VHHRPAGRFEPGAGRGSCGAGGGALDDLVPGLGEPVTVLDAEPGPVAVLGGEARLQPPEPAFAWQTAVPWAVLFCGVAIMGAMAWRMGRAMSRPS
jgi:hypothetical protein